MKIEPQLIFKRSAIWDIFKDLRNNGGTIKISDLIKDSSKYQCMQRSNPLLIQAGIVRVELNERMKKEIRLTNKGKQLTELLEKIEVLFNNVGTEHVQDI